MKTIWKYPLELIDENRILVPFPSRLLTVAKQGDGLVAWYELDPNGSPSPRRIFIRGTGHPFTGEEGRYITTVFDREFVWHIYDVSL
jgi:hypothetical protein